MPADLDVYGQHKERHKQYTRSDTGNEKLTDRLLSSCAVDDGYHAGRDEDAQGAAGGNRGRSQRVVVVVFLHLGKGYGADGGGGGGIGAAHRAEARAGDLGCHSQTAAPVANQLVRKVEQLLTDP